MTNNVTVVRCALDGNTQSDESSNVDGVRVQLAQNLSVQHVDVFSPCRFLALLRS